LKVCLACGTQFAAADWRCPGCGHVPKMSGGFPQFAPELAGGGAGYDTDNFAELARLEARNFWFRARNSLILWALARYFSGAASFLEIGCGTGFVLSGVAAECAGLRLTGSEVHADGLAFAEQRVPHATLMQMDARRVPYDSEFDVVGAFDVIEHIEDDRAVLREMHRAVAPGGGILLTVPQHPFLWSEFDVRAQHVRRYTASDLREKVGAAGFDIVKMTSFVSLLLPLMFASRLTQRAAPKDYDPLAELRITGWLNGILESVLDVERMLIRLGVSFPAGGSLLIVARKI
jgi:SAM-dependent methyltransferase